MYDPLMWWVTTEQPVVWGPSTALIPASIWEGIEQARRNEGTTLDLEKLDAD
jgi:hypothetical protein